MFSEKADPLRKLIRKMLKRKSSRTSVDAPFEMKRKRVPWRCSDDQRGNIDCSSPKALMQSLLGDKPIDEFFDKYWEKQAFVLKRNDPNFYGSLFTYSVMKEVLTTNEFEFHTDVSVSHEKEIINEVGKVTVENAERLLDQKKVTFQFYHPQRYIDELWRIVEKLETYFGCLVGSNAFITPADSKGLLPHCDDVEIFVLHIEGKVEWKLYQPMVVLSRDYNQDLLEETIGEPTMTVVMEPGDLLYFPRGTIHQCKASDSGHSTYIYLSTYLHNTWGDFMRHAVTRAIETALEDDASIRSGLPINYVSFLGTGKDMSKYIEFTDEKNKDAAIYDSNLEKAEVVEFKKTVQGHLSKLVDHIDVNLATDSMCMEFISSRLPPHGYVPEYDSDEDAVITSNENAAPDTTEKVEEEKLSIRKTPKVPVTLDNLIKFRFPEHVRLLYDEDGDDDDSDYDSDDEMEVEEKADKLTGDTKEEKADKPDGDADKPDGDNVADKADKEGDKSKSPRKVSKGASEGDDDEDEDAVVMDEPSVKVVHSLHNDRFSHMGFSIYDEVACVKLSVDFAKAAVELMNSNDYVAVNDLLLDDDEAKLSLANKLAGEGLLEIKV